MDACDEQASFSKKYSIEKGKVSRQRRKLLTVKKPRPSYEVPRLPLLSLSPTLVPTPLGTKSNPIEIEDDVPLRLINPVFDDDDCTVTSNIQSIRQIAQWYEGLLLNAYHRLDVNPFTDLTKEQLEAPMEIEYPNVYPIDD